MSFRIGRARVNGQSDLGIALRGERIAASGTVEEPKTMLISNRSGPHGRGRA